MYFGYVVPVQNPVSPIITGQRNAYMRSSKNDTAFNYNLADAQATAVEPAAPQDFPYGVYEKYEQERRDRCRSFQTAETGVLVYRRMRAGACFSAGCANPQKSLELQLGALRAGTGYAADIPNFLEPWYGIGLIASAFGAGYKWEPGQAPAILPPFRSIQEALNYPFTPVAETAIGRHTLDMIEYFVKATGGRLPVSLSDTQSPLNAASLIVDVSNLLMDAVDEPDTARRFFDRIKDLQIEFIHEQQKRIGNAIVWPGHGFASSREFKGLGQSDDNVLMMSNDMYQEVAAPSLCACAQPFGGVAFHSCGNWSNKLPIIRELPGIRIVDAAFGPSTDPGPNPPEPFAEALSGTGIILNARIVGSPDTVLEQVEKLWRPGMKLIVVTYCQTPAEQAEVYERIHQVCV